MIDLADDLLEVLPASPLNVRAQPTLETFATRFVDGHGRADRHKPASHCSHLAMKGAPAHVGHALRVRGKFLAGKELLERATGIEPARAIFSNW
jgi:hypothetical protein